MKILRISFLIVTLVLGTAHGESLLDEVPGEVTLFKNVRVFDGTSSVLRDVDVLVVGNLIHRVEANIPTSGTYEIDIATKLSRRLTVGSGPDARSYVLYTEDTRGESVSKQVEINVIDGGGRVLMPGLHDMHTHIAYFLSGEYHRDAMDPFHLGGMAALRAEQMLMNGFTTIRDLGGPAKFMQKIIDNGSAIGPRIYPSEAWVTQTSGHGDKREYNDLHPNQEGGVYHQFERYWSFIADGPTEVRRGVRESLRRGATQIKIHTGGGVTSPFDPLHTVQFTPGEIKAAVEAAAGWKTYVTTHAFIDEAVRIAVENGVQCIEHYAMITEDTAKLMADKKVWAVTNMESVMGLPPEEYRKVMPGDQFDKLMEVLAAFEKAVGYMAKHNKEHMAYGTDIVNDWTMFPQHEAVVQNKEFIHLAKFLEPVDVLKTATSNAGRLAKMSGPNDPYPHPTGVVEPGAYADLILVDGNPLEEISLMVEPAKNFDLIMKDGVIYKNTLH